MHSVPAVIQMCRLLTPDFPQLTKREGSSGSPLQMEAVGLQLSTAETGRDVGEASCQETQQEEEAQLLVPSSHEVTTSRVNLIHV